MVEITKGLPAFSDDADIGRPCQVEKMQQVILLIIYRFVSQLYFGSNIHIRQVSGSLYRLHRVAPGTVYNVARVMMATLILQPVWTLFM